VKKFVNLGFGLVDDTLLAWGMRMATEFLLVNVPTTSAASVEIAMTFARDEVLIWNDILGASSGRRNPGRGDYVAGTTTAAGIFTVDGFSDNAFAANASVMIFSGIFANVSLASTAGRVNWSVGHIEKLGR